MTQDLVTILRRMRRMVQALGEASIELRQDRLGRAVALIEDNFDSLVWAMDADSAQDLARNDLLAALAAIKTMQYALAQAASTDDPRRAWAPVAGLVAPRNFPLAPVFVALAQAFAAGSGVMLHLPGATPRTSALLLEWSATYFGPDELVLIVGDAATLAVFAGLAFDRLMVADGGDG